jgi:hypothetical protein
MDGTRETMKATPREAARWLGHTDIHIGRDPGQMATPAPRLDHAAGRHVQANG